MKRIDGRTALITGASAGLGTAYARELARRGADLVLTARREERLQALADELRAAHGVQVLVLPADLADPAAPARLLEAARGAGRRVDYLVNNAGYGLGGRFNQRPWQEHADFLQVMVTAVVQLTYLTLPAMREQGFGRVLNVASLAGLLPGSAGHTLYAAAKSFLIKMSESLSLETRGTGVHVTATCPGFTFTEFHDVLGNRAQVSQLPRVLWMDADRVVRESLVAVERGDALHVPGGVNSAIR